MDARSAIRRDNELLIESTLQSLKRICVGNEEFNNFSFVDNYPLVSRLTVKEIPLKTNEYSN